MSGAGNTAAVVDEARLAFLLEVERARYAQRTPRSAVQAATAARAGLFRGVPMSWMAEWNLPHPLHAAHAQAARLTDLDGNEYIDFCLADTGAMFGHSPPATVAAIRERVGTGMTTMLPAEDGAAVADELARRFRLPLWQLAMTASDANRFVIRLCRALTGRPKILVVNHCYHGSVGETLVELRGGQVAWRSTWNINPGVQPAALARVVEFNDVTALERELAAGDVACALLEPVMTNCGMVLPDPGYHQRLRELTRAHGVLLVNDETHTFSSGPGGYSAGHGLQPDFITVGKAIAGGLPAAAYGFTAEVGERLRQSFAELSQNAAMGIGGTLTGNALQLAAIRATLDQVATEAAYARMLAGAERLVEMLRQRVRDAGFGWSVSRCGARVELHFAPDPPRNGSEAVAAAVDWRLIACSHLHLANRGLLMTPFHNMMLVSPVHHEADIDALVQGWASFMALLQDRAPVTF